MSLKKSIVSEKPAEAWRDVEVFLEGARSDTCGPPPPGCDVTPLKENILLKQLINEFKRRKKQPCCRRILTTNVAFSVTL